MVYRPDSYIDIGPAVSLLRYAKGDRQLMDYARVYDAQVAARSLKWDFE
jgi:hypothetical protein